MESHKKQSEDGILIGNQIDKNQLANPISRRLVKQFDKALFTALDAVRPSSIHEIGCGEGRLARQLSHRYPVEILASDFSATLIQENQQNCPPLVTFKCISAYEINQLEDNRDTIICCEVLEHLETPEVALQAMARLGARAYIFSVPHEPIWRGLNILRLSYLKDLGNTPGHLNHWSYNRFIVLLRTCGFTVEKSYNPFPWIMVRASLTK